MFFVLFVCLFSFNPRLQKIYFETRLTKVVVTISPYIFAMKPPILMILVLEERYGSPLSIETKLVPSSSSYFQWS